MTNKTDLYINTNSHYGRLFRDRLATLNTEQAKALHTRLVEEGLTRREYWKALAMVQEAGL